MSINEPDHNIIQRYLDGTASPQEVREVEEWYRLMSEGNLIAEIPDENEEITEVRILNDLRNKIQSVPGRITTKETIKRIPVIRWVAAASVLFVISGLAYYFIKQPGNQEKITVAEFRQTDALPGATRATLTLSNGKTIILDTVKNGLVTKEAGSEIINANGSLEYTNPNGTTELVYNTLSTQRGEQFPVTLSDGTRAWLNANSSIRFPVSFSGPDRNVQVTGEVYFEVAQNKNKPFQVTANTMLVEVLGTSFNINSYTDEPEIRTTLLDGSVKIKSATNEKILQPGEQVRLNDGKMKVVTQVNTEEIMAWKNGLFRFDNTSLEVVMRQLSRWYDMDIVYEGKIPDKKFGGGISRKTNLSQVLEILEVSQVKFKIEGKKIIVNPN